MEYKLLDGKATAAQMSHCCADEAGDGGRGRSD